MKYTDLESALAILRGLDTLLHYRRFNPFIQPGDFFGPLADAIEELQTTMQRWAREASLAHVLAGELAKYNGTTEPQTLQWAERQVAAAERGN